MKPNLYLCCIILAFSFLSLVNSLEFGAPCSTSDDKCNTDNNLICNSTGPGTQTCACNLDIAIEDPNNPCICRKFGLNLGDECEGIGSLFCPFPGGSCNGANCVCNATHYFEHENTCEPYTTQLFQPCPTLQDEQCAKIEEPSSAHCSFGVCICKPTHTPHPSNQTCIPFRQLHQPCNPDSTTQCLGVGVICRPNPGNPTEGTCSCGADYFLPISGSSCLKYSDSLDDPCVPETPQCDRIPGAECTFINNTSTCRCNPALYVPYNNSCHRISSVNGTCNVTAQCQPEMGPNSVCLLGQCGCGPSSTYLNGRCFLPTPLHGGCSSHEECYLGTNTNAGCLPDGLPGNPSTCQCRDGKDEIGQRCYGRPLLSEGCVDDFECSRGINGSVICLDGFCRCVSFSPSLNMDKCAGCSLFLERNNLLLLVFSFISLVKIVL